jgi:hypothetical protein
MGYTPSRSSTNNFAEQLATARAIAMGEVSGNGASSSSLSAPDADSMRQASAGRRRYGARFDRQKFTLEDAIELRSFAPLEALACA